MSGYWKDRKTGKREAGVIPVKSPRSYGLCAKALSLTLPADIRNGNGDRLTLRTKGILRFSGTPETLELKSDRVKRRWYARQVMEVPEPERRARPEKHAAVDLGARVLVALTVAGLDWKGQGYEGGQPLRLRNASPAYLRVSSENSSAELGGV